MIIAGFEDQSDEDEDDRDLLPALASAFFEPDLDEREEAGDEARDSLVFTSSPALVGASVLSAAVAEAAVGALDSDAVEEDDEDEREDLDEPEDEEEDEDDLDDEDRDEPDDDRDDEDLRRLLRLDSRERLEPRRSRLLSRRLGGPRSTGRRRS